MKPQRPVSSVRFLRQLAGTFGGLDTIRGRGLHKAAAHMMKLGEELQRCEQMVADREIDHTLAAAGIYAVAREETIVQSQGAQEPPEWSFIAFTPEADRWIRMARAAHGAPVYEEPAHGHEMDGGTEAGYPDPAGA